MEYEVYEGFDGDKYYHIKEKLTLNDVEIKVSKANYFEVSSRICVTTSLRVNGFEELLPFNFVDVDDKKNVFISIYYSDKISFKGRNTPESKIKKIEEVKMNTYHTCLSNTEEVKIKLLEQANLAIKSHIDPINKRYLDQMRSVFIDGSNLKKDWEKENLLEENTQRKISDINAHIAILEEQKKVVNEEIRIIKNQKMLSHIKSSDFKMKLCPELELEVTECYENQEGFSGKHSYFIPSFKRA